MTSPKGLSLATFSSNMTECPLRSHSMAAQSPAKPAPTMITLIPEGGSLAKLGIFRRSMCEVRTLSLLLDRYSKGQVDAGLEVGRCSRRDVQPLQLRFIRLTRLRQSSVVSRGAIPPVPNSDQIHCPNLDQYPALGKRHRNGVSPADILLNKTTAEK